MHLDYLIHLAKRGVSDIHPGGEKATYALLDALNLHPGECVLEIGCGTGRTMERLAQRYPVAIFGIELLPEMLAAARRRLHIAGHLRHICLVQSRGETLPFPDQAFDKVFSESVLGFQDVAVVRKMLHEIQRVLRGGGLYVANEAIWRPGVDSQIVEEINHSCEADFGLRQATDRGWSISDWLEAMQACELNVRSADLLEARPLIAGGGQRKLSPQGSPGSRFFNRFHLLRRYLDPEMLAQLLRYRRLLRSHLGDGQYIEGRLLIMEKL
jgi:SAM-dependent methyltransferase